MAEKESALLTNKHVLLYTTDQITNNAEVEYIKNNFCGIVCKMESLNENNGNNYSSDIIMYLCGDIEKNYNEIKNKPKLINVIKELSYNYSDDEHHYELINIGQVPINVHNVGVYFRTLFNSDKDYFNSINNEHQFQALTESNKPNDAFRKGIYLTKVEQNDTDDTEIKFKLLRCSSNLHGPTDNFRDSDNEVVNHVNDVADHFFENKADMNHVLAQIYENKIVNTGTKFVERKAKIKEHSDKTKDMPKNGLIAFCTFYKDYSNEKFNNLGHIAKSKVDSYDYCFKNVSVLTKIRFRLKKMVIDETLKKVFDVVLYPNSVFIISLLTNRLYTHEIIPSQLPIDKLPIRMGYVIRCSNVESIFKNNQTYINENGNLIKLEKPNVNGKKELKDLYFKENVTDEVINYNKFYFSLNDGDYEKPIM